MIETTADIEKELKRIKHYVWLGFKDYCKDRWHDWLLWQLKGLCGWVGEKDVSGRWIPAQYWKEGSIRHYISQRKIVFIKRKACLEFYIEPKGK